MGESAGVTGPAGAPGPPGRPPGAQQVRANLGPALVLVAVTDLIGKQAVLMTGSALFAAALLLLAVSRRYSAAIGSVLLLGAAWAMLINVGNVLTPLAFPGRMAHATNLANVFFGLGAFLTP